MPSVARAVLAVVVVVVAGFVPVTIAGAASPTTTVTVDGTTLAPGDSTLVDGNPSVGVTVDAEQSIEFVSVRVDGTTVRRATPNATTFDDTFDIEMSSGEHTLTVVVKTDTVTSHAVTVTKDTARPYVQYSSPFETDTFASPPDSITINRSSIDLAGNFTDVTGVTHLRIVRQAEYTVGSETRTDRDTYTASAFDDSFSQPIFLGIGRNNITARYYDRVGYVRTHQFEIVVEDTAPPTLSDVSAVRTSPKTLQIRGVATDNGQIRHVAVHPEDSAGTTYLVDPGIGRPDPERQRVSFETNRTLYPGSTAVVIEATDTAGNTVERTVTVSRTIAPELRLNPAGTRFVDEGTVAVRGRAAGGEIASVTVETVDPETGEVVDIASVHSGSITTDITVEKRLDAPSGQRATVRLRVIDSAGTEHVTSLNRTLEAETPVTTATATPTPTRTPTATPTPAPTASPDPPDDTSGPTVPLLGVTLPPILGTSVGVPVPLVGPFDVPILPAATLVVVGLAVVARAR